LIGPAYTSAGVWNSAHWKNEEFSQLMKDYGATADLQQQRKLAAQAAALMNDETPVLISYWLKQLRAKRKNLHGIASGPASHLEVSKIWKSQA
jgi:peptide/nickel transport system substrate-binding protein